MTDHTEDGWFDAALNKYEEAQILAEDKLRAQKPDYEAYQEEYLAIREAFIDTVLAHEAASVRGARIDELEKLIESTKCYRPECRQEHKVKRSSIDNRIAALRDGTDGGAAA